MTDRADMSQPQLLALVQELEAQNVAMRRELADVHERDRRVAETLAAESERFFKQTGNLRKSIAVLLGQCR